MSTLTKKDFVDTVANTCGADRDLVRDVLQTFLDQVTERLATGERIEFRDFGVFEVRQRAARTAQNPKTLQRVSVPPRRTVKFKPGRLMKDRMTERQLGGGASAPAPASEMDDHRPAGAVRPTPPSPARRSA